MEKIHEGWLLKSPPEKNSQGPWKWFTSKWRRRYFVLYGVQQKTLSLLEPSSLCTSMLCYYSDDQLTREHGRIDLKQCQEIHSHLHTNTFPHVLAVRTQHEGMERTYCLAAESERDMIEWEKQLNSVLCLYDSGFDQLSALCSQDQDLEFKYPTLPKGVSTSRRISLQTKPLSKVPTKVARSVTDISFKPKKREFQRCKNTGDDASSKGSPNAKTKHRFSISNMIQNVGPSSQKRRPSCPAISISNSLLSPESSIAEGGPSGSSTPLILSSPRNILGKNTRLSLRSQTGQYKSSPLLVDMSNNSGRSDCSSLSDDDKLNTSPKSSEWNSEDSLLNAHCQSQDYLDKHATLKPSSDKNVIQPHSYRKSKSPLPPIPPRIARSASMEGSPGSCGAKKYIKRSGGSSAATMGARNRIEKGLDTSVTTPRAASWRSEDMSLDEMGESSENDEYDSDYNYPTDWDCSESVSSMNDSRRKSGARRGSESESCNRYSIDNVSDRLSLNCTLDERYEDHNTGEAYDDHYDTLPTHDFSEPSLAEFGARKTQLSIVMESTESNRECYDFLPTDGRRKDSQSGSDIGPGATASAGHTTIHNLLQKSGRKHYKSNCSRGCEDGRPERDSKKIETSQLDMTKSCHVEGRKFSSGCSSDDGGDDDVYDVPQFLLSNNSDDVDDSIYDTLGASSRSVARNSEVIEGDCETLRKKVKSTAAVDEDIYDYVKPLNSPENATQSETSVTQLSIGESRDKSSVYKSPNFPRKIQTNTHNSSSIGDGLDTDLYDTLPSANVDRTTRDVRSRVDSNEFYDTLPPLAASDRVKSSAELIQRDDIYDTLPASMSHKPKIFTDNIESNIKFCLTGPQTDNHSSTDNLLKKDREAYATNTSESGVTQAVASERGASQAFQAGDGGAKKGGAREGEADEDGAKEGGARNGGAGEGRTVEGGAENGGTREGGAGEGGAGEGGAGEGGAGDEVVSIKFTRNTRSFKRRDNSTRKQLDVANHPTTGLVVPRFEPSSVGSSPDRLAVEPNNSQNTAEQSAGNKLNTSNLTRNHADGSTVSRAYSSLIHNQGSAESSGLDDAVRSKCRSERKVKAVTMEFEKRFSLLNVHLDRKSSLVRNKSQRPLVLPKPDSKCQATSVTSSSSGVPAEEDIVHIAAAASLSSAAVSDTAAATEVTAAAVGSSADTMYQHSQS